MLAAGVSCPSIVEVLRASGEGFDWGQSSIFSVLKFTILCMGRMEADLSDLTSMPPLGTNALSWGGWKHFLQYHGPL